MNDGLDVLAPLPAHSDLGASGMDRWSHCPGSFALGRRERHRLPTIHAATGTVAHDIVERCVQSPDPIAVLASVRDTEIEVDGHVVPVTDELLSGVQTMLAYVAKRFTELGEVAPLVEQTVSVDLYFPPEAPPPVPMFGRADVQFVTPGLLEIIDYKNGSGYWSTWSTTRSSCITRREPWPPLPGASPRPGGCASPWCSRTPAPRKRSGVTILPRWTC